MNAQQIKTLHNFNVHEKDLYGRLIFGPVNTRGIKYALMGKVDEAISFAKDTFGEEDGQFLVHDINSGEHSPRSKHYTGEAIDGHFRGLDLYQTVMILFRFQFTGIGIYPDWKHPGIHADIRAQDHVTTWVQKDGEYIYDYNYFIEQLLIESEKPLRVRGETWAE